MAGGLPVHMHVQGGGGAVGPVGYGGASLGMSCEAGHAQVPSGGDTAMVESVSMNANCHVRLTFSRGRRLRGEGRPAWLQRWWPRHRQRGKGNLCVRLWEVIGEHVGR